jgi:hypothetical protein
VKDWEPMPGFEPCCDAMEDALRWGLLKEVHGEIVIVGPLPKGAKAGNVLTGEAYDPRRFRMGMALRHCPWCADPLPHVLDEVE